MNLLFEALKANDYSNEEALQEINEMRNRVYLGESPEEILYEYGLEPDYIFELI